MGKLQLTKIVVNVIDIWLLFYLILDWFVFFCYLERFIVKLVFYFFSAKFELVIMIFLLIVDDCDYVSYVSIIFWTIDNRF